MSINESEIETFDTNFRCPQCGATGQTSWFGAAGKTRLQCVDLVCDECSAKRESAEKAERQAENLKRRRLQIPEQYRDANEAKIRACYAPCLTAAPLRLGFIGPSDSGKTSAMACHIIRRDIPFKWLTGNSLREVTLKAAMDPENGAASLRAVKTTPLLAIDDISQPRFTEAFASALFDILEERNSHKLSIVWTSQKTLPKLRAKITEQCGDQDQADAISRRLIQDGIKLEGNDS